MQGRLKAGKCLWCGGLPHLKGVRCKERPSQKEKDGGRRKGKQAEKGNQTHNDKCSHCGKQGHAEKNCWTLHPELKPEPKGRGTIK